MDEMTKAYIAGLFDGEGSALIEKIKEHSYQIVVAIANTDKGLSEFVMKHFNGHYRRDRVRASLKCKDGRPIKIDCSVYFTYEEAKRLLLAILPYLTAKQDEALIVLQALYKIPDRKPGKSRRPRGVSRLIERFYYALQDVRKSANHGL